MSADRYKEIQDMRTKRSEFRSRAKAPMLPADPDPDPDPAPTGQAETLDSLPVLLVMLAAASGLFIAHLLNFL